MGANRIMLHQLGGYVFRERCIKAATHVNGGQLSVFRFGIFFELSGLTREIRCLGVRLRMNGHIFASRHRHRSRY